MRTCAHPSHSTLAADCVYQHAVASLSSALRLCTGTLHYCDAAVCADVLCQVPMNAGRRRWVGRVPSLAGGPSGRWRLFACKYSLQQPEIDALLAHLSRPCASSKIDMGRHSPVSLPLLT
jgi:hypothetical protein